ncbi:MAG: GspE/PulE family protein [Candidatus Methylacidiphilales bacterium]|nr:ATPase, T2SS/T4P/T4SS family [Candidatus Methylacidiphilales bacterium]
MLPRDEYILELLINNGLIEPTDAEYAKESALTNNHSPVDELIKQGMVTALEVLETTANDAGYPLLEKIEDIDEDVVNMVPPGLVLRYNIVPLQMDEDSLRIAISNPYDFETVDTLTNMLHRNIECTVVPKSEIEGAIKRYYNTGNAGGTTTVIEDNLIAGLLTSDDGETKNHAEGGDAPIIRLVYQIIYEAHRLKASDIHLEPMEKRLRLRYRIDGVLQAMSDPPKKLQSSILARIKIMANMSIAEKRLPQDGRIQFRASDKTSIDLRVSTVPTGQGESIVMRILDKSSLSLGLPELGFFSDDQVVMERLLGLPDGIFLVTGPTGSGKTTTLYGCLNYVNKPDRKIITVEDPVEYQLAGINQVPVNEDVGMTFAAALRAMLRQAPNIIMIGEVRDLETATIAINASLTGHLVFSTLHTNDAPSAVTRLVDLGVKPFLVASSVRAIMAQRLLRRICSQCGQPYEPTESEIRALNLDYSALADATFRKGAGCERCRDTGFKGRMGMFEILVLDDEIRRMVNEKMSLSAIRQRARDLGMRTLREDGIRKVLAGVTTPDEVITSTMGDKD